MPDLAQPRELCLHILVLLGLPALAVGCTPKVDGDKAEAEKTDKKAEAVTKTDEEQPPEQPEPSTTREPDPAPPDTGMDDGEPAEPAPLPEGAQFCFGLDEAKSIVEGDGLDTSGCPSKLDLQKTRERVDSWDRRTGGPWEESVVFVASDTPEGQAQRCCYEHAYRRVPGARPTRGRPLLVDTAEGARVVVPVTSAPDGEWIDDARVEHASVAAFARANVELMSLGAPPSLVRANLRAATDELEHARLCLTQAGRGQSALGALEPVAPRRSSLAELAERTVLEACIPETLGALAAARMAAGARAAGDHELAGLRARIAEDEARHAAAAWATLRWARSVDREAVDARLLEIEEAARAAAGAVVEVESGLDAGEAEALWRELLAPLLREQRAQLSV